MTAEYKIELPPVAEPDAEQSRVLDKAKAAVGFVPNMYAGMANSPGLLETYLDGYDRFRNSGAFTPPEQEVVFLTISRLNGCDYCVSAHSMIGEKKSGLDAATLSALREGQSLPDARHDALATFTRHMHETRGLPTKAAVEAFKATGYGDRHVYEIILAQAVKTLSNYANHVQHTALDEVFAGHRWPEAA